MFRHFVLFAALLLAGLVASGCSSPSGQLDGESQVNAGDVVAGQVTAGQVTAGAVSAGEVAAGDVVAGQVNAGQVNAGDVVAGDVLAGEVSVDLALTVEQPPDAAAVIVSTQAPVEVIDLTAVDLGGLIPAALMGACGGQPGAVRYFTILDGDVAYEVRALAIVECL